MGNYKAYFNSLGCKKYMVHFIGDSGSSFTEILLAGERPFTTKYSTSKTPFDPLRTSTSDISIVHNDYLQDIMSPYAQGTQVILYDITNGEGNKTVEWTGYLQPRLYSQGYTDEFETIEFTANDCLNTLQYIDYENATTEKGFVTIKSIIDQICNKCGGITGYYWTRSKKVGTTVLLPSQLKISEKNFYYSDTDEPWKLDAILEEICRYLGYTCLQWKDKLYFVDYEYLTANEDIYATYFAKATDYSQGSASHLNSPYQVSGDTYMGSDNDISFDPIYNKIRVHANFYEAEYFIPNIFDDQFLTNRIGTHDLYENQEIFPELPDKALYPYGTTILGGQKYREEESGDSEYRYFHRLYDHKYYESVYMDEDNNILSLTDAQKASSSITRDYKGGTLLDLGVVEKEHSSEYNQWIVPSKMDYTRYLCLCCKLKRGKDYVGLYKLKSGYRANVFLSENAFLVLNFNMLWERYENRGYINPNWTNERNKIPWTENGSTYGSWYCKFKLQIGNKWWTGREWVDHEGAFSVDFVRSTQLLDVWNTEAAALNNVSWEEMVNEEGYKIPLSGINATENISFEVYVPNPIWVHGDDYHYNAYAWFKDFSLKCVEGGQDAERQESDVIYENVIDEDAVSEMPDINVKLTTYTPMVPPSYSNVVYYNGTDNVLLSTVKEEALTNTAQKPEENIVEKYYNQYSTATKKMDLNLNTDLTPFNKVYGVYVDDQTEPYVVLGQEIDYQREKQKITLIQIK